MFAGHLAVALGARKVEPRVPLAATVAAAFGLDLLWPVLLLVGLETVRVSPGDTAFTNLAFDSYPWSHSLLLVLGWSGLAAVVGRFLYSSWRRASVLGLLVLSHWVLDLITHRPDLPLWPQGPVAGLGLWNSVAGTLVVEGALLAAGAGLYLGATTARDRTGRVALAGLLAFTLAIWVTQPWAPPPPSDGAVAVGGLALWLLLPWAVWIERHRSVRRVPDPGPA
jgi:hypothetical protein